jgi:hypothetical protein
VKLPPTFSAWNLLVAFDLVEHRRVLDLEHHGHCRHIEILHRAVLDGDFLASLSTLRNFTVGQRDGLRAVGSLLVPWCHPRPCIGAAAMVLIELSVAGIMYQNRKLNAADIGMGIVALAGSQRGAAIRHPAIAATLPPSRTRQRSSRPGDALPGLAAVGGHKHGAFEANQRKLR